MSGLLQVQWTLTPETPPQPLLPCKGCDAIRSFQSSGKFRLNAQGKRLDAWLIYRCTTCDTRWNRPIFRRRDVGGIDAAMLLALQSNDDALAMEVAFDSDHLRRYAPEIKSFPGLSIQKAILRDDGPPRLQLGIVLKLSHPVSIRVDRMLATALGLSRSRIQSLQKGGFLRLGNGEGRSLRKPVRDGLHVMLDLTGMADGSEIELAAAGLAASAGSSGQG